MESYDQTKKALRKYLGSERSGISIKERIKVKDEVFMLDNNENEQAYYNALPRQNSFYGRRIYSQNSQRGGRGRGDFRRNGNQYHRQRMQTTRSQSAVDSGNKNKRPRQLNPPDSDGKPPKCHICGSIFHFAGRNCQNCPESYENLQGVYQAEEDTEEVQQCEE